MTNKTRYIPKDYIEYRPSLPGYPKDMCAVWVSKEKPVGMFFIGKQSNAAWHYKFPDNMKMKEKINDSISKLMSHEDRKEERKAERKERVKNMDVSQVKVGDVYHWTGGYNCTRNDYVQVLEIKGKKATVAVLNKTQVDGDWMNGNVAPVLGTISAVKVMMIRPSYRAGEVILRDTKGYRSDYRKWNGKPNWENCD